MRRGGFTLIEVVAVITLMGLLAAATAWSLAGHAARSARENIMGQIAHADRTARIAAQRLGKPVVLRLDLDSQRIWRVEGEKGGDIASSHALQLPAAHAMGPVIMHDGSATDEPVKREEGIVEIALSTAGRSASYAVRIVSKDHTGWMVFAGMTGQMVWVQDENEIDNLFSLLATGRPDAD